MDNQNYKLSEITTLIARGITPKYTDSKDSTLVINQKCIRDGKINFELCRKHDHQIKNFSSEKILKINDILINSTGVGTLGRVSQVVDNLSKTTCDSHVTIVRPDPNKINPSFLGAFIYLNQNIIESFGHGSTGQTELSRLDLGEFKVPKNLSDIKQKFIGEFFKNLNKKIENNQKINETLEEISKLLFNSWFVDFDPVRAKSEGHSSGMNDEISDLFPDSFEDSHLGEIPKGWKIHKLGDFIDIKGGLSYKSQFIGSGKNLITMGCISPNKKFNFSGLKKYSGDFKENNLLWHKDVVISTRDVTQDRVTLGAPAMVPKILEGSIVATNLYKVIFINKSLSCYFLFESLKSKRYRENIIASAKGSTVLMLTRDSVLNYEIIVPQDNLMHKFHNLYEPMQRRYELINNEIETLVDLRDQLLPKLISGELRIPDAEKMIEEAEI